MSVPLYIGSPVDVNRLEEIVGGAVSDEQLINPENHLRI